MALGRQCTSNWINSNPLATLLVLDGEGQTKVFPRIQIEVFVILTELIASLISDIFWQEGLDVAPIISYLYTVLTVV